MVPCQGLDRDRFSSLTLYEGLSAEVLAWMAATDGFWEIAKPRAAIDAFAAVFSDRLELLRDGWRRIYHRRRVC